MFEIIRKKFEILDLEKLGMGIKKKNLRKNLEDFSYTSLSSNIL